MRFLITVQHPAHVHFFRPIIELLAAKGHEIKVCTRDRPIISTLLNHFEIQHTPLIQQGTGLLGIVAREVQYEWELLKQARSYKPDVMTTIAHPAIPHVATLIGANSVIWTDSGDAAPLNRIGTPFADLVCTPRSLNSNYGKKQIRYDGYHELSYLHPNRFQPDGDVLRSAGVDPDERYFVCRFVAWKASHDVGKSGFSRTMKRRIVEHLDEHGTVYVTSEDTLPDDLREFQMTVPPHLIHDLLYFGDLFVGDSQTMATEAAVLGTPAVRSNDFAGDQDMGNFIELEEKYGLLFSTDDEEVAFDRVTRLLQDTNQKVESQKRREVLLGDKIDVAQFAADVLSNAG